jgi:hypothetical protein
MADRRTLLRTLAVGDIFHAESPNGASLICLVISVTEATIQSRTVTTQCHLAFDRQTGIAAWGDLPILCTVDSIAPLPAEIHNVMLGIDQKFRLEQDPERLKLNDAEKRALIYVDSHYSSNML